MASPRWLSRSISLSLLVTASSVGFAACSDATTPGSGTTSDSAASSSGVSGTGGAAPTTTATTGAGGSTDDAGPLTCPTHSYSTIKNGPCDLLQQDCPTGQTCKEVQDLNSKWTTQCVAASGLKAEGQACGADAECRAKLTCAAGHCAPVCCQANNAPCLGGLCNLFIQLDGSGKVNKQVCHYAKACDLLTVKACDPGFACHIEDNKQGLATCVQPSGDPAIDLGDCHYLNDCPDMEHCLSGTPTVAGSCHFYCYLDQADPASPGEGLGGCPTGQTCQTVVSGAKFDFNLPNVGLCAPPG